MLTILHSWWALCVCVCVRVQVANLPLVPNTPIPRELFEMDQSRIVGLTIDPQVLATIRRNRITMMGVSQAGAPIDYAEIVVRSSTGTAAARKVSGTCTDALTLHVPRMLVLLLVLWWWQYAHMVSLQLNTQYDVWLPATAVNISLPRRARDTRISCAPCPFIRAENQLGAELGGGPVPQEPHLACAGCHVPWHRGDSRAHPQAAQRQGRPLITSVVRVAWQEADLPPTSIHVHNPINNI